MGLSLSLHISTWNEIFKHRFLTLTDNIENEIARSISFGSRDGEVILRTFSFKKQRELDKSAKPEAEMLKTVVPLQELVVGLDSNNYVSATESVPELSLPVKESVAFSSPKPICELDAAATKLQKVYKSYRTRRNLADCAVVIEELWWKTLDSAALNQSSISFFNNSEQETVASRWTRARKKAAKVGKGLSKDEKAQKLALHHWLEAVVGDGKEVNLPSCPRTDLQQQCIQYLGPKERETYEVIVDEGKLTYKQSGTLVNSTDEKSKWIFVLSPSRSLYVGRKIKGVFQHSSFLSGRVTTSAGRLVARSGILEAIWPYSGHYLPTEDNFKEFISFLEEHHVDMADVKRCSIDDDSPPLKAKDKTSFKTPADDYHSNATMTLDDVTYKELVNSLPNDSVTINTINIDAPKLMLPKSSSCKWTSGVGPRIGCVRDYPIELQSQALEKVNLSPTVIHSPRYTKSDVPIPSPRPSPKIRVSPRLTCMGLPSPRM